MKMYFDLKITENIKQGNSRDKLLTIFIKPNVNKCK